MNGYLIDTDSLRDVGKITAGIQKTIGLIYPDMDVDTSVSLHCGPGQILFIRQNSGERIWARIFFEPLTHILLETLEQDFQEIHKALKQWERTDGTLKAFVFFPILGKGVSAFFSNYASHWHFFEYYFLKSSAEEALALKEYKNREAFSDLQDAHGMADFIDDPRALGGFIQQTSLSREELAELLELALELKN